MPFLGGDHKPEPPGPVDSVGPFPSSTKSNGLGAPADVMGLPLPMMTSVGRPDSCDDGTRVGKEDSALRVTRPDRLPYGDAIPTIGSFRCMSPVEPWKGAS